MPSVTSSAVEASLAISLAEAVGVADGERALISKPKFVLDLEEAARGTRKTIHFNRSKNNA